MYTPSLTISALYNLNPRLHHKLHMACKFISNDKRYSGAKGSLCKASLLYAVCLRSTDSEVKSCVDVGDGSSVETVDEFCYPWGHGVSGW